MLTTTYITHKVRQRHETFNATAFTTFKSDAFEVWEWAGFYQAYRSMNKRWDSGKNRHTIK